jgi:hypothetical protein
MTDSKWATDQMHCVSLPTSTTLQLGWLEHGGLVRLRLPVVCARWGIARLWILAVGAKERGARLGQPALPHRVRRRRRRRRRSAD